MSEPPYSGPPPGVLDMNTAPACTRPRLDESEVPLDGEGAYASLGHRVRHTLSESKAGGQQEKEDVK